MSTEHNPRPGEPWLIRSVTSSYKATAILRMKPNTTDAYEWVIVAEDGRSSVGGAELPDGWVLVEPVLPRLPSTSIDAAHLARQREFSSFTFGPGARTMGVVDHIRKELREILSSPSDLSEWADVIILAFDGAWRSGAEPQQIIDAIIAKQERNEAREWPDWRTQDPDKAIEHDRTGEYEKPTDLAILQQVREYIDRSEHHDSWRVPCVYTKELRRILDSGAS